MQDMAPQKKKPGRRPNPASKRAQGVDRHQHPRKAFHAPAELLAALERYIADAKPPPTEAAALRLALEEFLEKRGYWPPGRK
jgi:hypothetical protein